MLFYPLSLPPCSLSLPYLRGQIGISPVANEIGYINGIAPFSKCQLSKGKVCAKMHPWCSKYLRCNFGKHSHCDSKLAYKLIQLRCFKMNPKDRLTYHIECRTEDQCTNPQRMPKERWREKQKAR